MSRFSPQVQVQDRSGEILGDAISQAFANLAHNRRQAKLAKQQEAEQQRATEMQDLQLAERGLFRGTAPMAPVKVSGGLMQSDGKMSAVTPMASRFSQLTPAIYRDQQVVDAKRATDFQDVVSAALAQRKAAEMADPQGHARGLRMADLKEAELGARVRALQNPEVKPVSWSTENTTEGIIERNPITGETRPLGGAPGRFRAPTSAGGTPSFQFLQTPEGYVAVNPKNPTQTVSTGLTPPPRPQSVELTQAAQANRKQMSVIDNAIKGLEAHPQAVGLRRMFTPDAVSQRTDPAGVPVRADIADIGSLQIHDRTGAAMTMAESERMKPFLPGASDQSDAAITKLRRLRKLLEDDTAFMEKSFGMSAQPSGSGNIDLRQPNDAPQGNEMILSTGKRVRLP